MRRRSKAKTAQGDRLVPDQPRGPGGDQDLQAAMTGVVGRGGRGVSVHG
jgi:hypothetical protein